MIDGVRVGVFRIDSLRGNIVEIDYNKTWNELTGIESTEPTYKTNLTMLVYRLENTPLKDWTEGDLTRMLGQGFSPEILVPMALTSLIDEPLKEGFFYSGDMLFGVLRMPASYFENNRDIYKQVKTIVDLLLADYAHLSEDHQKTIDSNRDFLETFLHSNY